MTKQNPLQQADTHEVSNRPCALENYNLYQQDIALQEATLREGASWATNDLVAFGDLAGTQESIKLGFDANANKPEFFSHDPLGYRVDEVHFHPAYHQLMKTSIEHGIHSVHWTAPKSGAQVARAAKFYMQTQVEAAHLCPITMTSAAIPALINQPDILAKYGSQIMATEYDHRNIPLEQKSGITIGMAMTEKQGGSDVQSNTTTAVSIEGQEDSRAYSLVGHKYFVSAPMSDAFLVLAKTAKGLSCFFLPRWRPDGTKNPMQIQQLKLKMGNVANASSETELRGAYALMVGEEGHGVRTIIDMVAMTRFDCMIGSAAGMRQAVVQAVHHCSQRFAFGARLTEQPLMQNVLADLIIESEAALAMTMRIARALDHKSSSKSEEHLVRIGTSIGKYWICKRQVEHAFEAMECIGGSGVMETTIMPRLYREAPINSIWEGSGNVQCLDMLRTLHKIPDSLTVFIEELKLSHGMHPNFDVALANLMQELTNVRDVEYRARSTVELMALCFQGALLLQNGDSDIAKGFCDSRLAQSITGHVFGNLPTGINCEHIIERARVSVSATRN
ncbi:acyl-CoA dehydrogenase family protein [Thalassotalea atypica]|uniref:acyl-CoA dehydrogenase family protein n=1 Tax=Thalassotalea atypica TaxID=2054316 RepID=UPI0025737026|nr:acyl-CoA dehydrogenase family protein [Thalassotalea atypica]